MTLTLQIPPTTVAIEDPEWRGALPVQTSWARAAIRVHGLLSQTLADEVIDELTWAAEAGFKPSFVVPPALAG